MKVLIIDDKPVQIERAVAAAKAKGWDVIVSNPSILREHCDINTDWIKMVSEVDGVMTDLMWNHREHGEKPMGLLVVIEALMQGKPVVICTNSGPYSGGHHGEALSFIYDGYRNRSAFGFEEDKDWSRAADDLAERLAG